MAQSPPSTYKQVLSVSNIFLIDLYNCFSRFFHFLRKNEIYFYPFFQVLSVVLALALVVSIFDKTKNNSSRSASGFDHPNSDAENFRNKVIQKRNSGDLVELDDDFNYVEEEFEELEEELIDDDDEVFDDDEEDESESRFENHKKDLIGSLLDNGANDDEVLQVIKAVDQSTKDQKFKIKQKKKNFIKNTVSEIFGNSGFPKNYYLHSKIRFNEGNIKESEMNDFRVTIFEIFGFESLSLTSGGLIYEYMGVDGDLAPIFIKESVFEKINGRMVYLTVHVEENLFEVYGRAFILLGFFCMIFACVHVFFFARLPA